MKPVRIAGDVVAFVLGEEGVLFSESRQELYTMNTAATFLWCLLEDGVSLNGLVEAYAETFGLAQSNAEEHIYPTLRRWFALGHISDPDVLGPRDTSLSAALAFLLTNGDLRERFRVSPEATGHALAVRDEDRDAFLALDPEALDRQAAEIDERRSRRRFAAAQETSILDAPDLLEAAVTAPLRSTTTVRCYRLLATTFSVTMPPALDAVARPVLAHLETDAASVADVALHVRESESGFVMFDGLAPVAWCAAINTTVPSLKLLLRKLAVARYQYFMEIHAGVVLLDDQAVLLPGSAGCGKTTLTAALLPSGGVYFSDEIALLEENTLDVRPMPLTMTIKPGSVGPLRDLYPALDTLDVHIREDRQPVRYLPPPPDSRYPVDQGPRPVKWVVFPHFETGGDTILSPVSSALGLRRLLDESLVLPGLLNRRKVRRLAGWARQLEFYDLRMSSVEGAVRAVRGLTLTSGRQNDLLILDEQQRRE